MFHGVQRTRGWSGLLIDEIAISQELVLEGDC